jgi:hypothetical protein
MTVTFPEPVKLESLFEAYDAEGEYSFTRLNHNKEYRARVEGSLLILKTPYDEKLVGRIKVPAFGYGHWDPAPKREWSFHVYGTNVREAVRLLTDFGFVFGAEVRDYLRELWR